MSDDALRPFFDAILAAPDDEAPRLALAAFLTERGDPRGANIRIGCELERLERDDPKRAELEKMAWEGPCFVFFSSRNWVGWDVTRRRGFVEKVECGIEKFVAHADELMRDAPIREYRPRGGDPTLLAQCSALAKLRCLDLGYTDDKDVPVILASPHLRNLRELDVSGWLETKEAVETLDDQLLGLPDLRVLRLFGHVQMDAIGPLAKLAQKRRLETLHFVGWCPKPGLDKMRDELGFARVLPRPEPLFNFKEGTLDLSSNNDLTGKQILDAINSGQFTSATRLNINGSRIGSEGVAHLASSGAFPWLKALSITGISDDAASVLAQRAINLNHLESIWLGEVSESYHPGVTEAGVDELARSPRLPALRTIGRQKWFRSTFTCPANEVRVIRRDDGAVVTSTIHNDLWD